MHIRIFYILLIIFTNLYTTSYSAITQFITNDKIKDFENGQFNGVTLNIHGQLSLSASQKEIFNQKDILYVWSSAKDNKGNIYFGTGNKPKIYKSYKGQTPKLIYTHNSGTSINSISIDSKNNIYASIIPDGTIIKINNKLSHKTFAKLNDTYIWDLIHDKQDNLYAATGSNASIYKITKNAKITKLFSAKNETNFLCLAINKNNEIIFGSSGQGVLYKLNPKSNKTSVLYDSYENEIKNIAIDKKNNIYFSTASKIRKYPPQSFDYRDSFVIYGSYQNKNNKRTKLTKKLPLKNSIYKITPNGKLTKLITLNETLFLSLALDKYDTLYAGSAEKGIIYKIKNVNDASIFLRTKELYILSLLTYNNNLIATTGKLGKIININLNYPDKGNYLSQIFNTNSRANWGIIKWETTQKSNFKIFAHTRTGNTALPDETWSKWSKPYINNKISYIKSPPAQYIQYKLTLYKIKTRPSIKSVSISYLPNNRAPTIDNINIKKEHTPSPRPYNINKNIMPNNFSITWEANDQDNDMMNYNVYYKEKYSKRWFLLKKNLHKNNLSFDSRKLKDGEYYFKITASDHRSNTKERTKISHSISKSFKIDNSPPAIQNMQIKKTNNLFTIKGTASDKLSIIKSIHYSINSKEWTYINPNDLIYDSNNEHFTIKLKTNNKNLVKNENTIILRCSDNSDNFSLKAKSINNK